MNGSIRLKFELSQDCRPVLIISKFNQLSINKKSAESDVAPSRIKSYKFLFVLKKNLFCSIQEIDGLVCKKNGQSRIFGILACKI